MFEFLVNNFDALPADCICIVSFKEELYSTLSLFNQMYKCVPVTYCPIQGGVAILLGMLHAKETGINKLRPLGTLVPVHPYLTFTSRLHSWDGNDNLTW